MFWDNVSGLYDFAETVYNGRVYRSLGEKVAAEIEQNDIVLECACGTGAISRYLAPKCRLLIATDFSRGMLKQTAKNCRQYHNVKVKHADMTQLKCRSVRPAVRSSFRPISMRPPALIKKPYSCLNWPVQILKGSLISTRINSFLQMQDTRMLNISLLKDECPALWQ